MFKYVISGFVGGLLILVLSGCSKKEEQQAVEVEEDKGAIERMTDETADKAVKKIRSPIDKARSTQEFGDDRLDSMDKMLEKQ
jgi:hypothetical protein